MVRRFVLEQRGSSIHVSRVAGCIAPGKPPPPPSYHPSTFAKINGATMVASLSMTYFGVSFASLPQVIFSFGTAPEYDP